MNEEKLTWKYIIYDNFGGIIILFMIVSGSLIPLLYSYLSNSASCTQNQGQNQGVISNL